MIFYKLHIIVGDDFSWFARIMFASTHLLKDRHSFKTVLMFRKTGEGVFLDHQTHQKITEATIWSHMILVQSLAFRTASYSCVFSPVFHGAKIMLTFISRPEHRFDVTLHSQPGNVAHKTAVVINRPRPYIMVWLLRFGIGWIL